VSFYAAGTLVREGHGAQLFDGAAQAATQRAIFDRDLIANGYPLPAFVACAFAPLSALPFVASYWTWFGINIAMLCAVGSLFWRELRDAGGGYRLLLIIACAASTPVVYVVVLGQIDLFVLGSLLGCYALLKRDRPLSAGCVLGLAIAKPHLVAAAVLLLLVKREWRALAGFAAVAAPLLVAPVFAFGPGIVTDQARLLFAYPGSSTDYNVAADMMVNVRGLVVSIVPSARPWLWLPPLAAIGVTAIALAVRAWRRNDVAAPQSWALALILPLLYSPHVHIQTMVFLLAAAVLFASAQDAQNPRLRPAHMLGGLVAIVVLWLVSVAGVSLLCVVPIGAFYVALRAWPARAAALTVEAPAPIAKAGGRHRAA
jgi:hypothetical protein